MEIQTLARRLGLPVRLLRRVVDERLLPGVRGKLQEQRAGRPRSFTELEAYYIALASLLLRAGLKGKNVTDILSCLADMPVLVPVSPSPRNQLRRVVAKPRTMLDALYSWSVGSSMLWIGDGAMLRFRCGDNETGWIEPRTLATLDKSYRPHVSLEIDLERIRKEVLAGESAQSEKPRRSNQSMPHGQNEKHVNPGTSSRVQAP